MKKPPGRDASPGERRRAALRAPISHGSASTIRRRRCVAPGSRAGAIRFPAFAAGAAFRFRAPESFSFFPTGLRRGSVRSTKCAAPKTAPSSAAYLLLHAIDWLRQLAPLMVSKSLVSGQPNSRKPDQHNRRVTGARSEEFWAERQTRDVGGRPEPTTDDAMIPAFCPRFCQLTAHLDCFQVFLR